MVQVTPTGLKTFHGAATIIWMILMLPTLLWWKESILWVAVMSVWANVAGHFSGYQGARAEDSNGPSTSTDDPMDLLYQKIMWAK